jgi:hypothetical protein
MIALLPPSILVLLIITDSLPLRIIDTVLGYISEHVSYLLRFMENMLVKGMI